MYGALETSVSGLVAQRTRLNVASANIANSDAILDPSGNADPYRRRIPLLSAGGARSEFGVRVAQIVEDTAPPRAEWDPTHPAAAKEDDPSRGVRKGYVYYPNVNREMETVNALEAMRSYEANIAAADASKSMMSAAMRLIA